MPPVPKDIRPEVALTRIDVLAWGLRRLAKYHLSVVDSPSVQFECGGVCVETSKLTSLRSDPNFHNCILSFEMFLPTREIYSPPLNIRVLDHRKFGRNPIVGVHSIPSLAKHRRAIQAPLAITIPDIAPAAPVKVGETKIEIDAGASVDGCPSGFLSAGHRT